MNYKQPRPSGLGTYNSTSAWLITITYRHHDRSLDPCCACALSLLQPCPISFASLPPPVPPYLYHPSPTAPTCPPLLLSLPPAPRPLPVPPYFYHYPRPHGPYLSPLTSIITPGPTAPLTSIITPGPTAPTCPPLLLSLPPAPRPLPVPPYFYHYPQPHGPYLSPLTSIITPGPTAPTCPPLPLSLPPAPRPPLPLSLPPAPQPLPVPPYFYHYPRPHGPYLSPLTSIITPSPTAPTCPPLLLSLPPAPQPLPVPPYLYHYPRPHGPYLSPLTS